MTIYAQGSHDGSDRDHPPLREAAEIARGAALALAPGAAAAGTDPVPGTAEGPVPVLPSPASSAYVSAAFTAPTTA